MNTNVGQFTKIQAFEPLLASFITSADRAISDKQLLVGFRRSYDEIIGIVSRYYTKEEALAEEFKNGRLTLMVRDERHAELRLEAELALTEVKDLSNRRQQLESVLFAKPLKSDADRIISALIQREIRDELREMDALQLTGFIMAELEANPESEILEAFTQIPSFMKKITPEQERGYLKQRGLARNPQFAEELSQVETINGLIDGMKALSLSAVKAQ